jgi:hypothetical protein
LKALDALVETLFCEKFRSDLIQHVGSCSQCQAGIVAIVDQLPMLKMIPGLKEKLKELQHGNGKKSGKAPAQGAL